MQEAFWLVFGAHQGAIGALIDVIGLREIAAGGGASALDWESRNAHRRSGS